MLTSSSYRLYGRFTGGDQLFGYSALVLILATRWHCQQLNYESHHPLAPENYEPSGPYIKQECDHSNGKSRSGSKRKEDYRVGVSSLETQDCQTHKMRQKKEEDKKTKSEKEKDREKSKGAVVMQYMQRSFRTIGTHHRSYVGGKTRDSLVIV